MIEVTITEAQYRQMQYDSRPDDIKFVRRTKTTFIYAATREVWEREGKYAADLKGMGREWMSGNGVSAGSFAGRVAKALRKTGP